MKLDIWSPGEEAGHLYSLRNESLYIPFSKTAISPPPGRLQDFLERAFCRISKIKLLNFWNLPKVHAIPEWFAWEPIHTLYLSYWQRKEAAIALQ